MSKSIVDLFRSETEIPIKASELFGVIREAAKAELMQNAVNCEVPYRFIRETTTGEKEQEPEQNQASGQQGGVFVGVDMASGKDWTGGAKEAPETPVRKTDRADGLKIVRTSEQGAEWIDIQDIIRKGRAPVSLPVGTEIHFTLKNGEIAVVAVAALNHYEERDAVFHFRRIIGRHCMNQDNKNAGGRHDSDARRYINEELIRLLPDELVAVIAEHESVQSIDGMKVESIDRLFLPSEYEAKGANDYAEYNGTDKQLTLFEERIKRIVADGDGDPVWWWLADPSAADTTNFCHFNGNGHSSNTGASSDGGIAPLFVIK